jgi:hypothetical protein
MLTLRSDLAEDLFSVPCYTVETLTDVGQRQGVDALRGPEGEGEWTAAPGAILQNFLYSICGWVVGKGNESAQSTPRMSA